ncbi:uncharacterized protein LOC142983415 isoform X2 [Anticarsia gemmatalis]|uniref:uncharacterized protein LOC142983415 isoform X2 n=1 Tax=Anticarsia gemmatalis TaxID=129554 RepID=UPI003F76FF8C
MEENKKAENQEPRMCHCSTQASETNNIGISCTPDTCKNAPQRYSSKRTLSRNQPCLQLPSVNVQTSPISCSVTDQRMRRYIQAVPGPMPQLRPKSHVKDTSIVTEITTEYNKDLIYPEEQNLCSRGVSALIRSSPPTRHAPKLMKAKLWTRDDSMASVNTKHSVGTGAFFTSMGVGEVAIPPTTNAKAIVAVTSPNKLVTKNFFTPRLKNTSTSFIAGFFRKKTDKNCKKDNNSQTLITRGTEAGAAVKFGRRNNSRWNKRHTATPEMDEKNIEKEIQVTNLGGDLVARLETLERIHKSIKEKKNKKEKDCTTELLEPKTAHHGTQHALRTERFGHFRKETKEERKEKYRPIQYATTGTHAVDYDAIFEKNIRDSLPDVQIIPIERKKLSLDELSRDIDYQSSFTDMLETEISPSSYSSRSDEDGRTDTSCVYSLATVDYNEIPRRRRCRIKLVTKTNQATTTDKPMVCDMATYTHDWWSPIGERKNEIGYDKKKTYNVMERQRTDLRRKNDVKGGRCVKFKSRTQIIPTCFPENSDIMSPSRYLLESQKYYNELFAFTMRPPPPVADYVQYRPPTPLPDKDKTRSPRGSRRNHQHHYRTKRLEECYSPRRQFFLQYCPKGRNNSDSTRTSDTLKKRPNRYWKSPNRYIKNTGRRFGY